MQYTGKIIACFIAMLILAFAGLCVCGCAGRSGGDSQAVENKIEEISPETNPNDDGFGSEVPM